METNQAVDALVKSANDAIEKLQTLNANNRVGVIAYSGNTSSGYSDTNTASVILPLGRYTAGLDSNNQKAYLISDWSVTIGSGRNQRVYNYSGVKVANGVTGTIADGVTSAFDANASKVAAGGTYIQNGLAKAWQMFSEVKDTSINDGLQAGTERVPIMVLLSDGAPTTATNSYTSIGKSNNGNGTNNYATAGTAFLTQLTASWVRDNMAKKYGTDPLFYTLGLNVGSNDSAKSVLDPSNNTNTDSYWQTFIGLKDKTDKTMDVLIRNYDDDDDEYTEVTYTESVSTDGWSEDYVTQYYPASNAAGLIESFSKIVQQIIIQSLYYPTMVESGNSINHDGFLHFEDYIGKNMEVKAVKGIQLGTKLYTGETLAKMIYQGGMGTVENPSDAGNNLVWSVQQRLGIESVTEARTLIGLAYSNGQLYYNPDTDEYSNYIGWYADASGKYVGFWDGKDASPEAVPAELKSKAVFAIKSYGYYDAVGEGHRKTDMMYATIQVRTTLVDSSSKTDASEVGDVRVIGNLPASLIPLVEYNVKLNGTDTMAPTELTVSGATSPSRLLYEVGLSSKIDLLDIEGTAPDKLEKDSNGNYVFYTNQWDTANEFKYSENKNTITYFEPSIENERYYYDYDTPIYTNKNGTLYEGDTAPQYSAINPYYHRTLTYIKNGNDIEAIWTYEQISEYVLDDVSDLKKLSDNTWVVKRGTIHHYFGDYEVEKTENATGTFGYSDKPFVHEPEVGATLGYHIDSYLGNNGKLTIDPQEGIKITKTSDSTITDKNIDYTFTITEENGLNATVTLIKQNIKGERATGEITFVNGVATVTLKHGESAWILGTAMIGKTFTVAENDGEGYTVESVNGDNNKATATITVAANVITAAAFVNTEFVSGDVVISKTVVSEHESHQAKEFEITVALSGDMLKDGDTYNAVRSDGKTYTINVGTNTTVALKHGQHITISDLPDGAKVTATEADYSNVGFTPDAFEKSAEAASGEIKYIEFTNTYSVKGTVSPTNVIISGIKNFVSNTIWNKDITFSFRLQKFDEATNTFVNIENNSLASVTYRNDSGEKTFNFNIDNESYSTAGTYSYRVLEIIDDENIEDGIIYDTSLCYFDIIVSDDGLGKLYISDVVAGADTVVNESIENNTTKWEVVNEFINRYDIHGAGEAVINIDKLITSENGVLIPLSGFKFELYESDKDWTIGALADTSPATSAGGKTDIAIVFDDSVNDIGTHYYVIKELVPAEKLNGVTYSQQKYGFKVVVGHAANLYTIELTAYDLNGDTVEEISTSTGKAIGNTVVAEITSGITFTNTYTPEPVALKPDITVSKVLSGRDQKDNEFSFNLYETDKNFNTESVNPVETKSTPAAKDGVASTVSFSELKFDKVGNYYYVIKEAIPAGVDADNKLNGVIYDTSEYRITVKVTGDNTTGKLSAVAVIEKDGHVNDIIFTNKYVTTPVTDVIIGGTKKLDGNIRKLQARAYSFELIDENGYVVGTVSNGIPTDDYNAPFSFNALSFDTVGTYNYTIREKLPDGANKDNNYTVHGVIYDSSEYKVQVVVTDNGDGTLGAKVNYLDGDVQFVNHYNVKPTSIVLGGTKKLVGDSLSKYINDKAFKYELYAAEWNTGVQDIVQGAKLETVTNIADGSFAFGELNFDKIGAYRYIIREYIPDNTDALMNYDVSVYQVEVDVTDDLKGGLNAVARVTKIDGDGNRTEVSASDIIFTNVYDPEPITVALGGKKNYNMNLPAEKFSFELYQALKDDNDNINAIGNPVLTALNDNNGNFRFEEIVLKDALSGTEATTTYITFDRAGTYYFVIKECLPDEVDENNTYKGVTYDTNEYKVTITVTESEDSTGRNTLSYQTAISGISSDISFTNSYDAAAKEGVVLSGNKTLTDKALTDGAFKFALYNATVKADGTVDIENEPIETVTNKNGKFTFGELKYTSIKAAKLHYYVIKEVVPDGVDENNTYKGVTYDATEYLVSVNVTDNGDGTLAVAKPVYILVDKNGKKTDTAVNSIDFANSYDAAAKEGVVLSGKKSLKDKKLIDDAFKFELYNATVKADGTVAIEDKPVETVTNKDGKYTFSELKYTSIKAAKLHYYVIKEVMPDGVDENNTYKGVTYDSTVYLVSVDVTDNGDGTLAVAKPVYTVIKDGKKTDTAVSNIDFNNSYDAAAKDGVVLSGKKLLTGKILRDGAFKFAIYKATVKADGTVELEDKAIETVTNIGDSITFSELKYTSIKDAMKHFYVIKEVMPEGVDENNTLDGMTYDSVAYLVSVDVTDNGDGTLSVATPVYTVIEEGKASDTVADSITFNNKYTPKAITYSFSGTKHLRQDGKEIALDGREFSFALYLTDNDYVIKDGATPIATIKNGADGKFQFTGITADADGKLYYVIKELVSDYEFVVNDTTVYEICVTVVNEDGTLVATPEITANKTTAAEIKFINEYKPVVEKPEPPVPTTPPENTTTSPQTGDSSNLWMWFAAMFVSGTGVFVTLSLNKKSREDYESKD